MPSYNVINLFSYKTIHIFYHLLHFWKLSFYAKIFDRFSRKSWLLFHTHFSAGLHKQRTYFAIFPFWPLYLMFLFYAHSSAIAKTWAILIGNSPRKRRIWRPPTKSLWWIWIKTSLQDSPFSIQSLCSMSEKPIPIAPPSSSYKPILPKHLAKMIFKKSLSRLTFLYYQFSAAIQSEVIAAASTYSTYFPFRKHSMLINVFHHLLHLLDVVYNTLLFLKLLCLISTLLLMRRSNYLWSSYYCIACSSFRSFFATKASPPAHWPCHDWYCVHVTSCNVYSILKSHDLLQHT